jgi:hypothetical protein
MFFFPLEGIDRGREKIILNEQTSGARENRFVLADI